MMRLTREPKSNESTPPPTESGTSTTYLPSGRQVTTPRIMEKITVSILSRIFSYTSE
jgi:hypothetical protein